MHLTLEVDICRWMTKLLVTPSKLLLQTGGVLIGTCVFVAGLILMLYIKEKVMNGTDHSEIHFANGALEV